MDNYNVPLFDSLVSASQSRMIPYSRLPPTFLQKTVGWDSFPASSYDRTRTVYITVNGTIHTTEWFMQKGFLYDHPSLSRALWGYLQCRIPQWFEDMWCCESPKYTSMSFHMMPSYTAFYWQFHYSDLAMHPHATWRHAVLLVSIRSQCLLSNCQIEICQTAKSWICQI